MREVKIYLGSPNDTHVIGKDYAARIEKWAEVHLQGYTWQRGRGYWNGTSEESVILTVLGQDIPIVALQELRDSLAQECIMATVSEVNVITV